jgi:ribosome-binding protein aMBF1 (putative translation factor)
MIAEETINTEVARLIYEARKIAGLIQAELAGL